jgi:hypothetical protein
MASAPVRGWGSYPGQCRSLGDLPRSRSSGDGSAELRPFLASRLHPTREVSEALLQRGQIVAAAWESVIKTTCA